MSEEIKWFTYYQNEAKIKSFLPWEDASEEGRVNFAISLLPKEKIESALDVGCAEGFFCSILYQRGVKNVCGIDISELRINRARELFPQGEFKVGQIYRIDLESNSFDLVTAIQVLEHLGKPELAVSEISRIARKFVLFTVPYREEKQLVLCPRCGGTFPLHGHIQRFDEKRIRGLCESNHLKVVRINYFVDLTFLREHILFKNLPEFFKSFIRNFSFRAKLIGAVNFGVLAKKVI